MSKSPEKAVHDTIIIERTFEALPNRVFNAWQDSEKRSQWENPSSDWDMLFDNRDFRTGGHEISHCGPKGDMQYHFHVYYLDITPNQRIVYASTSSSDEDVISASLTTIQFFEDNQSTRMIYNEQIAFFEGGNMRGAHEHGMNKIFDNLDSYLS